MNTKFLDVEAKLIECQHWADLTSTYASGSHDHSTNASILALRNAKILLLK